MKNSIKTIGALVVLMIIAQVCSGQFGMLEAVDGIKIGNNSGNVNGTIRYTGADFEGRKNGSWVSLTNLGGSTMWNETGSNIFFNAGKVGIGVDDPSTELHVEGGGEILRVKGTNPWLSVREEGGSNYGYNWMSGGDYYMGVSGQYGLGFRTNNNDRMMITATGEVGIGTNAPAVKLHIEEDDEALRIDGANPWISFYNGGTYKGYIYHDGDHMSMSNEELGKLSFRTNSTTRMTIEDNGNVGIGVYSPVAMLDVRGDAVFNENGSDSDFRIESDNESHVFYIDASADEIGIGTDNPLSTLHVNGTITLGTLEQISDGGSNEIKVKADLRPDGINQYDLGTSSFKWVDIWAVNGTIQTSDRRLKKDIKQLPYGLAEIMKLKPVKFKWNESYDQSEKLGLLAQDVLPVIKEVVKTHHYEKPEHEGATPKRVENERMGVYYSDLIPVLIKGMQEQQAQIELLKAEMETLKKK